MSKKAFFYIDDVIWPFRDLTRQRPASMFEHPFLKLLKTAHEKYGMKVQLNVFYRTDFFYGDDEFTLAEMTDAYKAEWESASDWLKLGFHSKQEFPDYPYINADYETVKNNFDAIKNEVVRFAGEKSFALAVVPHWMPISLEGVEALRDGGIKLMNVSSGPRTPYNGDPSSLPYGHAMRLLNNRKPETELYIRGTRDVAINTSLCAYNHLTAEETEATKFNFGYKVDEKTGMCFRRFTNAPGVNLSTYEQIDTEMKELINEGREYIGYGTHEQYFYPDYFAYQPDYPDKLLHAAELLHDNGYEYFFIEEIVK